MIRTVLAVGVLGCASIAAGCQSAGAPAPEPRAAPASTSSRFQLYQPETHAVQGQQNGPTERAKKDEHQTEAPQPGSHPPSQKLLAKLDQKLADMSRRTLAGTPEEQMQILSDTRQDLGNLLESYGDLLAQGDDQLVPQVMWQMAETHLTMARILRSGEITAEAAAHEPSRMAYEESMEELARRQVLKARRVLLILREQAGRAGQQQWVDQVDRLLWELE